MVRIINVCSGKGGVGKTTLAINLGVALQKFYSKVAVVDLNLTTSHVGLVVGAYDKPRTLNDFLRGESKLEDVTYTHGSGLRIVPASLDVKDIINVNTDGLKQKLKEAFKDYDIVLLDSAPSLGRESLIAMQASDEALFVATPHIPSLTDVVKCNRVMSSLEAKPSPIGIVVNRVKNKRYEIKLDEIRQFTDLPVIGSVPEDEKILESANKRTVVADCRDGSASKRAFFEIAAKIAGREYRGDGLFDAIMKKLGR